MAKIKMSKKAASIDMTAMCDVAFLLLTFFILTATAKQPEPLSVKTPASTVQTKLPETGLVTITIGKQGGENRVFFGMKDRDIREKTLELMGNMHNEKFTPDEVAKFKLIDEFGVPIGSLKQIIAMKSSERNKAGLQPGVPIDTLNGGGELKDWIYTARQANAELHPDGKELEFAIKGDAAEQYPEIHRIMDILQDQKINSFSLVTGLRANPRTQH